MATVPALPDALSPAARAFCERDHGLLIDGEWVKAGAGASFESLDPATGNVIATLAHGGEDDIDAAVAAARNAFAPSAPWRTMSAAERSQTIWALADLLERSGDELAELESLDNGKPLKFARYVDVASSVAHLRYYAGWPTKIEGATLPVSMPNVHAYTRLEPVGVCGQIVPWNFPLLMACWKIGPALAAGCTDRPQARRADPADRAASRRARARGRHPAGRAERRHGRRVDRRGARRPPGRRQDRLHRLDRRRPRDRREGRPRAQARHARARRQVAEHHPRRTPTSAPRSPASFAGLYFNSGQACNAASRLLVPEAMFDEVVGALAEQAQEDDPRPGP